ncbi:thiamine pyrophosphate-dependent enzyme [Mesorhizobium australafricanum]|uniref:Thiamine pyrophosphate-binding protein n=1 Tax=Mesorhizobium australafricanum TaxID=3072311 RepID=A0ABU4X5S8_9HYPH|nr:thiamine pyrophosphate-dependent enzyme [Mesorhizobium sp. VK3E]MDX8443680.1 thiamine pyrophosphate-binding protein [Mesorhizobium sp. VK3E]
MRTGGQVLVEALKINGAEVIFGVPGESYLAALDAIRDQGNCLRYITMRQEGGASFAAAAYGDLTGRPGVCFVTRGPGVTSATIGLHTAMQGSTPMILLIGQISRPYRDREVFQEIDYRRFLGQTVKWVAEVDDASRLPEYVNRAFKVAVSGRPGPAALALPEDMLFSLTDAPDLPAARPTPAGLLSADIVAVGQMLQEARRPLLLLGGAMWTPEGQKAIIRFVETHDLPVAVGFRRQGLFPHDHPNFVGSLGFAGIPEPNQYARDADLIIALGSRLNDPTTMKHTIIPAPNPPCKLVHIHPGAEELGRLYQADLPILADPSLAATALAELPAARRHTAATANAKASYAARLALPTQPGPVDMAHVMRVLNERLPRDTTMTTGAGNASDWPNIHYCYREFLGAAAPVSGAMGMGVPAAIAAKLVRPHSPAVYIGGDGDFLMNGQELATAVQYGLDPIFIIIDNGKYGTIRGNQEVRYPGRVSGTTLRNPDFSKVAEGYGAHGERVDATADFEPALDRALSAGRAAVIHVVVGPKSLGPNHTLSEDCE